MWSTGTFNVCTKDGGGNCSPAVQLAIQPNGGLVLSQAGRVLWAH
jgi:hypothetical protein